MKAEILLSWVHNLLTQLTGPSHARSSDYEFITAYGLLAN